MIGVLDYGMGNIGSILNMLNRLTIPAKPISRPQDLDLVEKLILPGVGAFDAGMNCLQRSGFLEALKEVVEINKKPILGICLGMQLLGRKSEEGICSGLGWIAADVVRLRVDAINATPRLKVPHMGWNVVQPSADSRLFNGYTDEIRFYFVHSFHMVCDSSADVDACVQYGGPITAAVSAGNIFGVQFHPEKSHKFGMQLLRNFASC